MKNRDVILRVYNAQHHTGCLLLGTSHSITRMSAPSGITLFGSITNKCDEEQAFRHTATLLLLHKHHTANFIYPSMRGTLPLHSTHSVPPNAKPLKHKQGANKNKASRRAPSLLYAQTLTEKPNTDYPGHMISYCVTLSFMSSSYCTVFLPLIFLNVS